MSDDQTPLPSSAPHEEEAKAWEADVQGNESEEPSEESAPTPEPAAPVRPPLPTFKISTFLYVFLGLLGLWMLIDTSARNDIACLLGTANPICSTSGGPLYWLIGFDSSYLLVTMALAGAIEMLITSVAYNYTTNWIKAAKVQKWSAAFRKVQMAAIRSGKKDRIAALKPQQEQLTRLSGEVSIAQFKGMAITYFLLILIYTWVGLVIGGANSIQQTVNLGGTQINLFRDISSGLPIPWWFLIFSLYTVPFSLVFRRILKHLWLQRYVAEHRVGSPPLPPASGGARGPA
jgi:uncharacterized membrane protein (DUF106 family)